jgi:hypothetical protein
MGLPGIPGLNRDHVVIRRDIKGVDADGMASPDSKLIYDGPGSWRNMGVKEIPYAQALGQRIDGAVALPNDCGVLVGDDLTVRGVEWEVLGTVDVRLYIRALVRKTEVEL